MSLIEQGKELAQEGKYAEALGVFKKALEDDRKNADALFFIGTCYSCLGDFPAAKHFYQQVLLIDPEHARTRNVWPGMEGVEARPPADSDTSPGPPSVPETISAATAEDVEDKWAKAFPDTPIDSQKREGRIGVLLWILIAAAAAALVYFVVGPKFLQ